MAKTILIVDDKLSAQRLIADYLSENGFRTVTANNGRDALFTARHEKPDLVLLDIMMPEMDGFEFMRHFRRERNTPVIMLTAKIEETDKVVGLELGADDYVTKPFGMNELLARMRAALRRTGSGAEEEATVQAGDLSVDLVDKRVRRHGDEVHLTPIEWGLVEQLVRNRDRLVTQRQLLHDVWGPEYDTETNYLRVHMANVRRKLEEDPSRPRHFLTEPGMGYRFVGAGAERPDR